jgi:hypothetical protein
VITHIFIFACLIRGVDAVGERTCLATQHAATPSSSCPRMIWLLLCLLPSAAAQSCVECWVGTASLSQLCCIVDASARAAARTLTASGRCSSTQMQCSAATALGTTHASSAQWWSRPLALDLDSRLLHCCFVLLHCPSCCAGVELHSVGRPVRVRAHPWRCAGQPAWPCVTALRGTLVLCYG